MYVTEKMKWQLTFTAQFHILIWVIPVAAVIISITGVVPSHTHSVTTFKSIVTRWRKMHITCIYLCRLYKNELGAKSIQQGTKMWIVLGVKFMVYGKSSDLLGRHQKNMWVNCQLMQILFAPVLLYSKDHTYASLCIENINIIHVAVCFT